MGLYLQHLSRGLKRLSLCGSQVKCHCVASRNTYTCEVLIVGGGTGGCSVAWRLSRALRDKSIIVLEPAKVHYFQPSFTLVAAGIHDLSHSHRPQGAVLPDDVTWLCDTASDIDPRNNVVYTANGDKINYEFLVVAVGLKNDYDRIKGLKEALEAPDSTVSTIYSPEFCTKTWSNLRQFRGGHALFTFPVAGGKCSGAAQKIMYLSDDYWRRHKIRNVTSITYNTGGDTIFGVPKYAAALTNVACSRGIVLNYCANLVEVNPRGAVFTGPGGGMITIPFNFLHVTPPMSPPDCLTLCSELSNEAGYLDIHQETLQHSTFPNVYGLGDCTSTPNSKTAAAVSAQSYVVERNLLAALSGGQPPAKYNGYGACPMLTSYGTGILAEFLYNKTVCETFPFDQSKERRIVYLLTKHVFPRLYWDYVIKGRWNGPSTLRKILNPLKK